MISNCKGRRGGAAQDLRSGAGPHHARSRNAAYGRLHLPASGDEQEADTDHGDQRSSWRRGRVQGPGSRRGGLHRQADDASHAGAAVDSMCSR